MSVRRRIRKTADGRISARWLVDVQLTDKTGETRRVRRSPRQQTRVAAERLEREIIAEIEGYRPPRTGEDVPFAPLKFRTFVAQFSRDYVSMNNKVSEQRSKERIFRNHLCPYFGDAYLHEITSKMVDQYVVSARRVLAAKTVNNHLAVLARLFSVAVEWRFISVAPKCRFLVPTRPRISFLDEREVASLDFVLSTEPIYPMFVLALHTGMRLGELLGLDWQAVDLRLGRIHVYQNLNDDGSMGTPKSGRTREVPLNERVKVAFARLDIKREGIVFASSSGNRMTRMLAYRPLVKAMRTAGIATVEGGRPRRLGWHMLRHTFASHLVMASVPIRAVQELLGHASVEMTVRYAHLTPAFRRSAVEALSHLGGEKPKAKPR